MFEAQQLKPNKMNKILISIMAFGLLSIASCGSDDNNSNNDDYNNDHNDPNPSGNKGMFAGAISKPGGWWGWNATSTTAVYDDSQTGKLKIISKYYDDARITIVLSDTVPGIYTLFQNTINTSTYENSTEFNGIMTTQTNDTPGGSGPFESTIEITESGMTDGRVKGYIHSIKWYTVGSGTNDDVSIYEFLDGGEFDIGIQGRTITGKVGEHGIGNYFFADVDGTPFDYSIMLTGPTPRTNLSVQAGNGDAFVITIPDRNLTLGNHVIGENSGYKIVYSKGRETYTTEGTMTITTLRPFPFVVKATFDLTANPPSGGASVSVPNGRFGF